jgi:hypothetical protein
MRRVVQPTSQRKTRPVATPPVQAEHFAAAQLRKLSRFVHAATTHLLQG